ncbi:ABC transporter ATP-binding protein [Methylovulum psychrotolerans]|jgi:putative ABC transport system ATP-binding protein|uniref:ABC transporter ATP-binding protein n=1 Tax=Methylovulum psychrotolerans TaxID=1704499 RepID=UPI001BFFD3F1|nr:ABC transporter ATP-binding protein [Methylovulum psychrotolerans]MBT9100183.1 ABC transporter ATP-binding protein [Methylovulum psychrotolerans]
MPRPLISVSGLYKQYLINVPVLKDINFNIDSGEFVAIMGHSGSGKSTLMNILGCLDTATAGHYYLQDRDTATLSSDELANLRNQLIGFVFQGFNLLPRSSLLENIALPLLYAGKSKPERREKALQMLSRVGLAEFGERRPNQLSGGQQQRVAIARALVTDPKLILADEPTGNLDTQTSEDIMKIFQTMNAEQKITIILVTHEPDIAAHAQRMILVRDGQIASDTRT